MPIRQAVYWRAALPLGYATALPQHDGAARIVAHDVERVLAYIDADHGDRGFGYLRHGVLLGAPCQLRLLAGQEHGRTIPLADLGDLQHLVRDPSRVPSESRKPKF